MHSKSSIGLAFLISTAIVTITLALQARVDVRDSDEIAWSAIVQGTRELDGLNGETQSARTSVPPVVNELFQRLGRVAHPPSRRVSDAFVFEP